jgi:hypothetical protein
MSDLRPKQDPKIVNWSQHQRNEKLRIIHINEPDVEIIWEWLLAFMKVDLRAKIHSKSAQTRLQQVQGPHAGQLNIMLPELEMIVRWYTFVQSPTEDDKRVLEIITSAINPTPPPKSNTEAAEKEKDKKD